MNYQVIYDCMINRAIIRQHTNPLQGYKEKHHILPRSMGGGDNWENLVELTAREHFLAHWMLWRIHRNKQMALAMLLMCSVDPSSGNRYRNSKAYEENKRNLSLLQMGKVLDANTKEKISLRVSELWKDADYRLNMINSHIGNSHTEDTKKKMSDTRKGRKYSQAHCDAISKGNTGRVVSEDTKVKISEATKKGMTKDVKKKLSASLAGNSNRSKKVECITLNTLFDSAVEASRYTGISYGIICSICRGDRVETKCGLKFKYVD